MPCVSPRTQRLEESTAPFRSADILDGGPSRTDHQFEVLDQAFGLAFQPGSVGSDSKGEVHPLLGRPFFGCGGECDLAVDVAVHRSTLRHGSVVINDNLRLRVQPLDLSDEAKGFPSVSLWILRVPNDKRK